jgi:hypothetical protein
MSFPPLRLWLLVIVAQFEGRDVAAVSFAGPASFSTKTTPSALLVFISGTACGSAAVVPIKVDSAVLAKVSERLDPANFLSPGSTSPDSNTLKVTGAAGIVI